MATPRSAQKRTGRSAVLGLAAAGAFSWNLLSVSSSTFVGSASPGLRTTGATARRAGYAFDMVTGDKHRGIVLNKKDGKIELTTKVTSSAGYWNTVLGDKPLPASGRSYFEVHFLDKPDDVMEYIGVAEASMDVTLPVHKNKEKEFYGWGASQTDSATYKFMACKAEYRKSEEAHIKRMEDKLKKVKEFEDYDKKAKPKMSETCATWWTGLKGMNIGGDPMRLPVFNKGTTVGIDVDMDKGTLSFWENGKYLGLLHDTNNKPMDLKGKKLVPAMSLFGRGSYSGPQYGSASKVQIRMGLEPPPLP